MEPTTGVAKRRKWFDRRDKALGSLRSTISHDFLYHIASYTHPHDAWTTLEGIFGKPDRIRKFKLENELIGLNPCDFDNIQEFFSEFNSIILELSDCGITKDDEQLILSILSKLGPEYSIFLSIFYATMDALGSAYKTPSLDEFAANLTREQENLAHMGQLKPSKHQALVANDSSPKAPKGKGNKQHKDPKKH